MAAAKKNKNAKGNRGGNGAPTVIDRKLSKAVRTLTLKKIKNVLLDDDRKKYSQEFQEALILKLAGTILPRLNEHTGEDGGKIFFEVINYKDDK